jgi:hypothetical protein
MDYIDLFSLYSPCKVHNSLHTSFHLCPAVAAALYSDEKRCVVYSGGVCLFLCCCPFISIAILIIPAGQRSTRSYTQSIFTILSKLFLFSFLFHTTTTYIYAITMSGCVTIYTHTSTHHIYL